MLNSAGTLTGVVVFKIKRVSHFASRDSSRVYILLRESIGQKDSGSRFEIAWTSGEEPMLKDAILSKT
jgi:hypothetical protein